MADDEKKKLSEQKKNEANKLFLAFKYDQALQLYNQAIELDPSNPILYGNKAFANLKLENFGDAITDATKAIELDPKYVKGYYRRGSAHLSLGHYDKGLKDFTQAVNLEPNNLEARNKAIECRKAFNLAKFRAAIATDDNISATSKISLDDIIVDSDYDGPHWHGETMTLDFVKKMMDHFKDRKNIHKKYAYKILIKVREYLMKQPCLINIDVPVGQEITVCGDVHGQYYDVLNIFKINGLPSETNPYLFNGDFVDRGSFSCEVIFTFLAFKLLYPNHFFMARGNHESKSMNKMYGFEGEVIAKYSQEAYEIFGEVFCALPLAHVINKKILVVHGGLFSDDNIKLEDILKIDRFREPPESGPMSDILWSDPQPFNGRGRSKRGIGQTFGPDITKRFLEQNGLDLVIRSHEVKDQGYQVEADGKLITVFSAPNYCDQIGNKGAFIRFEGGELKPKFTTFDAVPHPSVPPMAYASPFFGM
eukprot:TRINITY_DN10345_c0_g1_i1.p1 TRINITY_DN10345_c0_g1~~TRINITY_DN10345_c0_g1_i1.p1  ORF type:complete len:478 (-),score=77.14 TRINITY_DN10345_c0_g1_i1:121-1554(-)